MAGNIVKWWKHKILGGYKQFSVQECTTDSEELMYHQVRASSSCSAPPDLLMVSDRENNIPLRSSVVNIITTTTTTPGTAHHSSGAVGSSGVQKHHQQQSHHAAAQQTQKEQQQQHQHCSKDSGKQHLKLSSKNKIANTQQQLAVTSQNQQQQQSQQQQDEIDGQQQQSAHQRHSSSHHQGKEERIRLEEFTCDVSVEGGKSTQPLQFSFTFYDLDGHHGKITKDDIVGIVYTIYESIGKSVVVPHCGSKTINVRLTVSPEGKSKSTTAASVAAVATSAHAVGGGSKIKKMSNGNTAASTLHESAKGTGHGHGHTRRQHRYRPRKLIKSDDEDDDSNSDKEKEMAAIATTTSGTTLIANNMNATVPPQAVASSKSKSHSSGIKYNKMKFSTKVGAEATATASVTAAATTAQQQVWYQEQQGKQQQQEVPNTAELQQQAQTHIDAPSPSAVACAHESLYENVTTPTNLKCCSTKETILKIDDCLSCEAGVVSAPLAPTGYGRSPTDVYMRQASARVKMLRKARKQKDHCIETRQRSLSVGNEACWYNSHVQQQQQQQKQGKLEQTQQQLGDVVDGVQLRNPHKNPTNNTTAAIWMQRQRNSAECWNTALNRNELMSIIRESMEKNRLCFQMSGKPQANVSPIRQPQHPLQQPHNQQRQRSNTVSKIPTLITNHSNAVISPNSSNNNNNNNNSNIHNTYVSNNNHHHHHHQHQHNHSHNNSKSNSNSSHSHSSNHTNNNSSELNLHDISTNNTTQYHPPQPHIPIYHQQMAINPAVLAAQSGIQHGHHSKMNLCGYDSFLHATICGGSGASHSPPAGANTLAPSYAQNATGNVVTNPQQQQLIATVQPIMTVVPSSNSTPVKVFLNSTTHQIKTSKILRSGSYSQQHAHVQSLTAHNSPQYHGYQRLSSSSAHHGHNQHKQQQQHIQQLYQQCSNKLAALNLASAQLERSPADHIEKLLKSHKNKQQRKDPAKYTDNNLLYAKLSEKLQEGALKGHHQSRSENGQRRKHKSANKIPAHSAAQNEPTKPQQQQEEAKTPTSGIHSSSSNTSIGNCIMLIPMHGDPAECENLIAPTTTDDDDAVSETPIAALYAAKKAESTSKIASANAKCAISNENAILNSTVNGAAETTKENNVATADLLDLSDDAELIAVESDVTLRASEVGDLNEMNDEGVANQEDAQGDDEGEDEGAEENGGCASLANTSGGSTSLIHRYVHEHIHHHYHHFEEKDDKM
ncbi:protein naked cuticle isoform X2 [Eurosta solidaginis]|uniref:protein naked cuticle isoform X2 n=1 Tax=Eurosta solidaginis TaxID=178769 RepID=UPI003530F326